MSTAHAEDFPHLTAENTSLPPASLWRKFPLIGLAIGIACLALAYVLGVAPSRGEGMEAAGETHQQFFLSYLTSFMFWLSLCLGGLMFTLFQHATRAGWSIVIRRIAENWMAVLPIFAVLVLPLFIGQHDLYHWSNGISKDDLMLSRKAAYFDSGFYTARTVVVLVLWTVFSITLYRWSTRQDKTGDVALSHKMRWWAPLGIIAFGLSITVAAIDWVMALEPHWYSTIYGVYFFAGIVMASGAAFTLSAMALQKSKVLGTAITTEHYHDLGKWTFAFIVFWTYIGFSQFFLIWYANIPEETIWFGHRFNHGWLWVSVFLGLGHFFVPFFYMMSRHMKRRRLPLALGAAWLLFAHYVDMFWLTQPALHADHFSIHIADLLTLVGIGGIVLGAFAWITARGPTVPIKDPRLDESLRFENF